MKKVSLELGGKGPVIVLDDADLDIAVDGALFACMLYSGQICESGTRLLVPSALHDEIVDRLVARASTITLGDPADFDTDMGPVVSARQRDRIVEYLRSGVAEGATVALGGGVPEGAPFDRGFWIEPTIFTDVTNDMRIAREEIFGPVLVVQRYDGVDEAVALANDTDYGLTARRLVRGLRAGARGRRATPRGHGLDQQLAHDRPGAAVRRLQAERRRARARAGRD